MNNTRENRDVTDVLLKSLQVKKASGFFFSSPGQMQGKAANQETSQVMTASGACCSGIGSVRQNKPMVSLRLNSVAFYVASERGQSPKLHKVAQGCGIWLEAEKAQFLDLGGLDQPGQHSQNSLAHLKLF